MDDRNQSDVDNAAIRLTEMLYLKRKQQSQEDASNGLFLGGQAMFADAAAHIRVGDYYEIDHSKLSRKTPHQLNCIRIIMVSKKTKYSVSLRFPSLYSLRSHFGNMTARSKQEVKMLPELDEKHVMGSELAGEVLYRRIPPYELESKRILWSFWVVVPSINYDDEKIPIPDSICCSELRSAGMVKWGQRRHVQYLSRHLEAKESDIPLVQIEPDAVKVEEVEKSKEESCDDEVEEEEAEEEESDDYKDNVRGVDLHRRSTMKKTQKRKCYGSSRKSVQRTKRFKDDKVNQTSVCKQNTQKKAPKKFIDRWSVERYKLAEKNMLKVLKEKGAVFGNPILRPALRSEARKLIGDTGLLDHLLKHMAGKTAPGGHERFRRRHNADGAMEYWLESADLVNIRKEAGVQDPYWAPPPGWTLGDNPTQDPICAKDIRYLKEEIAKLKGEGKEMSSKKQEDGMLVSGTPLSSVTTQNLMPENLLLSLKKVYGDLVNKKAQIEEQMSSFLQSLCGLEGELGKLKATVKDSTQTPLLLTGSTAPPTTPQSSPDIDKSKDIPDHNKQESDITLRSEQEESNKSCQETTNPPPPPALPATQTRTKPETKADKIVRLKSGFKICKPEGSFLWPNSTSLGDQAVIIPIEDLIGVPTPPSVSSSKTSVPSFLLPSPGTDQPVSYSHSHSHSDASSKTVKPLAEKRPAIYASPASPIETTRANSNSSINLNDAPNDNSSSSPLTYQRRLQSYYNSELQ